VQHTVQGGAGAAVRWYEINPAAHSLFQSGTVAPSGLFAFNAAISPDRHVRGTTRLYGANMVLHANRSSATAPISLVLVSKRGTNAASAPATIATSWGGSHVAFDCDSLSGRTWCRWGDYASASPDPASPTTATAGRVWGSSEISTGGPIEEIGNWTTWNFAATP
jgi:hypothetical protein